MKDAISIQMSEFIVPDVIYKVPINGGELFISPSCDFLHHFPNDAWMLKYWNTDEQPPSLHNVFMHEDSAQFLQNKCKVEVLERKRMGQEEHEQYLGWAATQLADLDFDIEDGTED